MPIYPQENRSGIRFWSSQETEICRNFILSIIGYKSTSVTFNHCLSIYSQVGVRVSSIDQTYFKKSIPVLWVMCKLFSGMELIGTIDSISLRIFLFLSGSRGPVNLSVPGPAVSTSVWLGLAWAKLVVRSATDSPSGETVTVESFPSGTIGAHG